MFRTKTIAPLLRASYRGQALVETLIVASVLALVAVLGVMLGKYQSIDLANAGASHSMAFECAFFPERCVAAAPVPHSVTRIRDHHVTDDRNGLRQTAAWTNHAGAALVSNPATDFAASLGRPRFSAGIGVVSNGAASAAGSAVRVISDLAGPGKFGLDITGGLLAATTTVNILNGTATAPQPDLRIGMPMRLQARSAILADFWNASQAYGTVATSVQSRVVRGQRLHNWVETAHRVGYVPTRAAIRLMGLLSLEEKADAFDYHRIDVDLIPTDRVGQ